MEGWAQPPISRLKKISDVKLILDRLGFLYGIVVLLFAKCPVKKRAFCLPVIGILYSKRQNPPLCSGINTSIPICLNAAPLIQPGGHFPFRRCLVGGKIKLPIDKTPVILDHLEGPMFELPEMLVLSRQMNQALKGKQIRQGSLGNSPHKFVWYNRTHEEFAALTAGKHPGKPM